MDIVGFTPISEYYKNNDDPEGLVLLVNEFLDAMTQIILNNGGTIDKYMGDCIMAFWNAPLPCANHAEMAVKSAIEIESKTNELKAVYKERGLPDINVGELVLIPAIVLLAIWAVILDSTIRLLGMPLTLRQDSKQLPHDTSI